MTLLQPLWLLLFPAVGGFVVLLHMRNRRPHFVSSTFIWRRVALAQRATPRLHRPVWNAALFVQLLVLLALLLVMAQPVWGTSGVHEVEFVAVIDVSASMQAVDVAPNRLEVARAAVAKRVQALQPSRVRGMTLVRAGANPDLALLRTRRVSDFLEALDSTRSTDAAANWSATARRLEVIETDDATVELVVVTDAQGERHARAALNEAFEEVNVSFEVVGGDAANVGITALSLEPIDAGRGLWSVVGSVSGTPLQNGGLVDLAFRPTGTASFLPWTSASIVPIDATSGRFAAEVELPGGGLLRALLQDADALAVDDEAMAAVGAARPIRVLIVGDVGSQLQKAVSAVAGVELSRADEGPVNGAGFDLVIAGDSSAVPSPETSVLWWGVAPSGASTHGRIRTEPTGWSDAHPVARAVSWEQLEVQSAIAMDVLPGAEPLLTNGRWPLIQARTTSTGREIVVAFGLEESNWGELAALPIFVQRVLEWAVHDALSPAIACSVGLDCRLPLRALRADAVLVDPSGEEVPRPRLQASLDHAAPAWAVDPREPSFVPQKNGIYVLRTQRDETLMPVNAFDPGESLLTGGPTGRQRDEERTAPAQFHMPLLWLALCALLAEAWHRSRRRRASAGLGALGGRSGRVTSVLRVAVLAAICAGIADAPAPAVDSRSQGVVVLDDPALYGGDYGDRLNEFATSLPDETPVVLMLAPEEQESGFAPLDFPGATFAVPSGHLQEAMQLARAAMPVREGGRIIIGGTGAETQGNVVREAGSLNEEGIVVDVVAADGPPRGDISIASVDVPHLVRANEPIEMTVTAFASSSSAGRMEILRDGEPWAERPFSLEEGTNRIDVRLTEPSSGDFLYEIRLDGLQDPIPGNNAGGAVVSVAEPTNVLIVAPQANAGAAFAAALDSQGVSSLVVPPNQAPWQLDGWLEYDAAVLLNVPALDLHSTQQEQLEAWVRHHGGGLLVLGGENTYGPGGYFQTALERLSPLSSRIPRDAPQVALVLVLDRSGSMQQTVADTNRLQIAKDAALASVDLLNEQSLTAIIAFDSDASVLAPLQRVDPIRLAEALDALQPGGGTSIFPGLQAAFDQLDGVESMAKHIVVMTDGLSQPADYAELMQAINAQDISVSTVAIGTGADVGRLQDLARLGGGAFHSTIDFQALPSILSQEAMLLSSSPVVEESVHARWRDRGVAFLVGVDAAFPNLGGFVETTAKPSAHVHLEELGGSPLLASWRYGLGRVVGFASHGAGAWTESWMELDQYALLWAQAARWAGSNRQVPGLHVSANQEGDLIHVRADATDFVADNDRAPRLVASVAGPAGEFELDLRPEYPTGDIHTGTTPAATPGVYEVTVRGASPQEESAVHDGSDSESADRLFVPFSARLAFNSAVREGAATALAGATGGRVLSEGVPDLGTNVWIGMSDSRPWWTWAQVALVLFVLELATRYGAVRQLVAAGRGTASRASRLLRVGSRTFRGRE